MTQSLVSCTQTLKASEETIGNSLRCLSAAQPSTTRLAAARIAIAVMHRPSLCRNRPIAPDELQAVQGVTWFQPDEDSALLELLRRWTVAYSRSLQVPLAALTHVSANPIVRRPSDHQDQSENRYIFDRPVMDRVISQFCCMNMPFKP